MCYRVYITFNAPADPMLALADTGLMSCFEVWLGLIAACMPTMAPFFVQYVKPAYSKLASMVSGNASSGRSAGLADHDGVRLQTFGGSGGDRGTPKWQRSYAMIPGQNHDGDSRQSILGHHAKVDAVAWTDGGYQSKAGETMTSDGIHVQRDVNVEGV